MASAEEQSREDILEQVYELAFKNERDYGSCAQCVLAAIQDTLGVGTDDTIKAAHALAGGGALTTMGTCGALVGALLAVGAKHGREHSQFSSGLNVKSCVLGRRVVKSFIETYGSPICAEVQTKLMGRSFNIWDGADYAEFLAAGGHTDKCTAVAGTAAMLAAEALLDS